MGQAAARTVPGADPFPVQRQRRGRVRPRWPSWQCLRRGAEGPAPPWSADVPRSHAASHSSVVLRVLCAGPPGTHYRGAGRGRRVRGRTGQRSPVGGVAGGQLPAHSSGSEFAYRHQSLPMELGLLPSPNPVPGSWLCLEATQVKRLPAEQELLWGSAGPA